MKLRKGYYYSTIRMPKKLFNQITEIQNRALFKPSMNDMLVTLIALGLESKVMKAK